MGKKLTPPQWFKDAAASYRARRATGDMSPSEMRELLADDIQTQHEAGDPLGRTIWIDFVDRHDRDISKAHSDRADEMAALEGAFGFLQPSLIPEEVLESLGLPPVLDLGGYGKSVTAPEARHTDMQKYRDELERKRESWDKSLNERIDAADRALAILPEDDSKTLREIIADPGDDYGLGDIAQ